jgi:hypothetical protein
MYPMGDIYAHISEENREAKERSRNQGSGSTAVSSSPGGQGTGEFVSEVVGTVAGLTLMAGAFAAIGAFKAIGFIAKKISE